jgi:hypothetical protein
MSEARAVYDTVDLIAIEARLAAATPGPWTNIYYNAPTKAVVNTNLYPRFRTLIANCSRAPNQINDATFIANTPTDIAVLLAEVKRLRLQVKQLTESLAVATGAELPEEE